MKIQNLTMFVSVTALVISIIALGMAVRSLNYAS